MISFRSNHSLLTMLQMLALLNAGSFPPVTLLASVKMLSVRWDFVLLLPKKPRLWLSTINFIGVFDFQPATGQSELWSLELIFLLTFFVLLPSFSATHPAVGFLPGELWYTNGLKVIFSSLRVHSGCMSKVIYCNSPSSELGLHHGF
jgi:hypothetical protein